jgi:hypothetical protein
MSLADEIIERVRDMILQNRRLTTDEVPNQVEITHDSQQDCFP